MIKKISKRAFILLSSAVLLVSGTVAWACSWWDPDEDLRDVVLMAPESAKVPEFSIFYLSNNLYYGSDEYGYYEMPEGDPYEKINLQEWQVYFGKKVTADEVKDFIYNSSEERFKAYREKIDGKSVEGEFPMLKCGAKKLTPALTYLDFAYWANNACEPGYDQWGEYEEPDPVDLQNLTNALKEQYARTKEPFLKQRYVFLLQRAYQASGLYSSSIEAFNSEAVKYDQKSSIYLRSMGYKAAALYKQQNYSEANYIYAILFNRMPESRMSAHWSFHPQEEGDWNNTLALAKTPEEKCAVWLMFGLTASADRALAEIYNINPGYIPARLLASRAVNQAEALDGDESHFYYAKQQDNERLTKTLSDYAGNHLSSDPAYWNLMAAYMHYQSGNSDNATKWLSAGRKVLGKEDKLLQDLYTLTEMLVRVQRSTTINDQLQKDLAEFLSFDWCANEKEMRTDAIYSHFMAVLRERYTAEKNDIMVALCTNHSGYFYKNNMDFIHKMLKFMQHENHNELETLLLDKYFLHSADLIEEIALVYLYNHELEKANKEFSLLDETVDLPGNPFNIRIKDCHDCDHEMVQKTVYTKATLVKKLLEMELAAKQAPKASAQTYFLLANAYYNITYFGNNRAMYESTLFMTGYDNYSYLSLGQGEEEQKLKDVYDCSRAEANYMLAYKYAPNKEFEAKCIFMAAKCEQNAFFMSDAYNEGNVDFRAGKYFHTLRDRYYDTRYFKEVIEECGYFKTYMELHPR